MGNNLIRGEGGAYSGDAEGQGQPGQGLADQNIAQELIKALNKARQTGALNLSNRDMSHGIPPIVFDELFFNTTNAKPAEITDLMMWKSKLPNIPKEIFAYPLNNQVAHIDLTHNRISNVPPQIELVKRLKKLCLGANFLTNSSLPPQIAFLDALVELDLRANRIGPEIPDCIYKLKNLTNLNLGGNAIKSVKKGFAALTSLKVLKLNDNKIASIEPGFSILKSATNLQTLVLRGNTLKEIPEEFFSLASDEDNSSNSNSNTNSLTLLDLSRNCLQQLPSTIKNLSSLKTLYLESNELSAISAEIFASLTSLGLLDIKNNKLTEIPSEIRFMKALTKLEATNNQIGIMPGKSLTEQPKLSDINLSFNKLQRFPLELDTVTSPLAFITVLELSYNNIESIDNAAFQFLPSLADLQLCGNKLKSIPSSIGSLSSLFRLNISDNTFIKELPSEIAQLKNLRELYAWGNQISSIDVLASMVNRINILDLSDNQIETLPNEVIDRMIQIVGTEHDGLCFFKFRGNPIRYTPQKGSSNNNNNNNEDEGEQKRVAMVRSVSNPFNRRGWSESKRFKIGFAEMKGRRPTMEDAVSIVGRFRDRDDEDFVALFDGHSGSSASLFASQSAHSVLMGLLGIDHNEYEGDLTVQTIRSMYKELNSLMRREGVEDGCTAVMSVIIKDTIYVSNLGDARAILCRNGEAIRLTVDHKPTEPAERDRIENMGGSILDGRVMGDLAVARAFGDFDCPYICDEPHIAIMKLELPPTSGATTTTTTPTTITTATATAAATAITSNDQQQQQQQQTADNNTEADSNAVVADNNNNNNSTTAGPTEQVQIAAEENLPIENQSDNAVTTTAYDSGTTTATATHNDGIATAPDSADTADTVIDNSNATNDNMATPIYDQFLILGCDGIFDEVGDQEACNIVLEYFKQQQQQQQQQGSSDNGANAEEVVSSPTTRNNSSSSKSNSSKDYRNAFGAAQRLRDVAYAKGSGDNISVIVVLF